MKRGRPATRQYPHTCISCGEVIHNNNQFQYHYGRYLYCPSSKSYNMEASNNKKMKQETLSYSLINYNPKDKMTNEFSAILDKVIETMDKFRKSSMKSGRPISNERMFTNVSVYLDDYDTVSLNKLKNYLNERIVDYKHKQEMVKVRVDDLLSNCELGNGYQVREAIFNEPPLSLEKLMIRHVRQRSLEELETTMIFVEALYVCVKESMIFKEHEETVKTYQTIEGFLEEHINLNTKTNFIYPAGQMVSQNADSNADDITDT